MGGMGLDLKVTGRKERLVLAEIVRPLTMDDVELLKVERGIKPAELQKIRNRHHIVAKSLVQGMTDQQICLITGYSQSRVSILKSDPAFKDLLALYEAESAEIFRTAQDRLASLSTDAADILQERLEEEPESISNRELMGIVALGADRTGNGPTTRQEIDIKIGLADKLAEARKRVENFRSMRNVTPIAKEA